MKKSKAIRQFVAEIVNREGDEEETEIVEHLVNIAAHVVNSDVPSDQASSESPYTFMKTTLPSDPDNISTSQPTFENQPLVMRLRAVSTTPAGTHQTYLCGEMIEN